MKWFSNQLTVLGGYEGRTNYSVATIYKREIKEKIGKEISTFYAIDLDEKTHLCSQMCS